jgi:hypothetical protein
MRTRAKILEPLDSMLCSELAKLSIIHAKASRQLLRNVIDSFVKLELIIQLCTPSDAIPL